MKHDHWATYFKYGPDLKCDVCGRRVAPISAGWAHEYDSTADFVEYADKVDHEPVVNRE